MAIKGADLLHVGDRVLIERAQTAGPGQVNLSPERLYELGNYKSIGILFDIPDLSFSCDSIDASAAFEAVLAGQDFSTYTGGELLTPNQFLPIDVVSEFKPGQQVATPYNVVGSVAMPYLAIESLSYKFGVKDKATQTVSLKGDSIFYNPGSAFMETFAGTNSANQTITLAHNAYPYNGAVIDGTKYALGVKIRETGKRLRFGTDYTESATGAGPAMAVTLTILAAVPTTNHIDVVYSSDTVATYLQTVHTVPSTTRPAAIRGRDIEVFVGGELIVDRWTSVQSVQADWKVTLDRNEEFGNTQVVSQDYFVPDVSGNIVVQSRDYADLLAKIQKVAGLATATEVAGAITTHATELKIVLHSPIDGSVLKTIEVPDARFTLPGYSGQVQQKLQVTFNFESDTGVMNIYNGAKIDVTPPGPVTGLATASVLSTSLTLNWTNPTDEDFSGVVIRQATGAVAPATHTDGTAVATVAAPTATYNVTGLTTATEYSFAVFAKDLAGNYSAAADVTVTTS